MAIQTFFVQDGLNVNNFIIANTTQLKVGTNTFVNSTVIRIGNAVGFALGANGDSLGSNGFYLTSNGTTVFWSAVTGGSTNTAATYTWTNTHIFQANVTIDTTAGLIANGSIGSNGLFLASNGSTVYWTAPTASAASGGPNTAVQFANSTAIAGNGNFTYNYVTNQLKVGTGGFAFDNDSIVVVQSSSTNGYVEIAIQNANTGNNSSSDLISYADTANDTQDFVDLGINGSNYNQAAFSIVGAKDGYLYTSNGHLAIGTAQNKEVRIHAGGTTANNEILSINATAVQVTNNIALWANGASGANGSVLTSNGTGISWSPVATITWAASAGQTWF